MTRIVAYTHNAAMHCPECTRERYPFGTTLRRPKSVIGPVYDSTGRLMASVASLDLYETGKDDGNGVGVDALDREGNPVRPVFATDEGWQGEACDDCGVAL